LRTVNLIRERVKQWRERGYPNVMPITRQLLNHWNNPDREHRLFLCQREAVAMLVWLMKAAPAERCPSSARIWPLRSDYGMASSGLQTGTFSCQEMIAVQGT